MSPTEQPEATSSPPNSATDAVNSAKQQLSDGDQDKQELQGQQQQEELLGEEEQLEERQEEEQQEEQPRAHRCFSVFNTTTGHAPASTAAADRARLVSSESSDFFDFLRHHSDDHIYVFDEPPEVHVLGGRSEESWPTRYVEYDVEVQERREMWAACGFCCCCMH